MAGNGSSNVFRIAAPDTCSTSSTPCRIAQIIDSSGDGSGNTLNGPWKIAVDSSSRVYVAGFASDNAFKIEPAPRVPALSNPGLLILGASLSCVVLWLGRRRGRKGALASNNR